LAPFRPTPFRRRQAAEEVSAVYGYPVRAIAHMHNLKPLCEGWAMRRVGAHLWIVPHNPGRVTYQF
jgi:hypothetical protein